MSADYFIFSDFDSRNYNIYLHNTGSARIRNLAPPKINVTDRPLGTSGEMLFDQYFAPKDIPLELYMVDSDLSEGRLREISTYLGSLGQKKLTLSYEDYKFYLAILDTQITLDQYVQGVIFNGLTFRALSPFGFSRFTTAELVAIGLQYDQGYYYDSGLLYAEDMSPYSYSNMINNQLFEIYHGGNCDSCFPVFKFTGGATTLKIEQFTDSARLNKIGEFNYGAFSGTLNIDCNLKTVIKNGVMNNNTFNGNYINLLGKTLPPLFNRGKIANISGTQITLESTASSVNDYYNGMSIYTLNNNNCIMERRVISDYVGSTKIATINSVFTSSIVGDEYAIHNPIDGKNYFKITGTGFSSLGLLVDFRYVYL